MARIKRAQVRKTGKTKLFRRARGFFLGRSNHRQAKEAVMHAMKNAYIGRKLRKRDFRRLWNQRINAAARLNGMKYSTFINGLKKSNIELNRKMLADLAVKDAAAFAKLAEQAKAAL